MNSQMIVAIKGKCFKESEEWEKNTIMYHVVICP